MYPTLCVTSYDIVITVLRVCKFAHMYSSIVVNTILLLCGILYLPRPIVAG